ncbi:MAG: M20 family metallopeptidase [Solobacterium sp.]|nr:M20 family metallopeptidase [Solobacterium sp.]MBQ1447345.1 M20 family metallopeptidase [Solobacterium sp.]
MHELKERMAAFVDAHSDVYKDIALQIHAKPEVSNYEFFAAETLTRQLAAEGFTIEMPAAGHRTGFTASYTSGKPGPVLVFLAEYDALAGLGHGCGHNLFGAASALAGAALKSIIDETGGEVRVYGTPGEEGGEMGSAKGSFVREGYFKDVDAALCAHPGSSPTNSLTTKLLANAPVDIEFWGRPAHAAAVPHMGLNALDAQILVFNAIALLRQQLTTDVRIHGIITDGGTAPNVIPEYTKSKFYIRAASMDTLNDVYAKIEKIVEGAGLQTGTKSSMKLYQNLVENVVLAPKFDALYEKNFNELGYHSEPQVFTTMPGSSDVGNVSQAVPCIQPMISITDTEVPGHSQGMVEASCSEKGLAFITLAAKVLANTALDLILQPEVLKEIKEEHAYNVEHQKELA